LLLNGAGSYTLDGTNNNVATLAASGTGALTYVDSNALTIGTVGSTNGIFGTGPINVATLTGDLTLAQNVATTNATSSAITLNAGHSAAAGTATGGNIVVSGSPTISTGAGGRATLYSGSATGNTSLAALIGSGSGRFRYNSDEATANYTAVLGAGNYAIYRQSINTALVTGSGNITYGDSYTLGMVSSGLVNGDSAVLGVTGQYSGANRLNAGSYAVNVNNIAALIALGYTNAGNSNGTLVVAQKALTIGGITAGDKVYDRTKDAVLNRENAVFDGVIEHDDV
ncbi:MAG: hypothetical protein RR718_06925, partial [Comamonas sp.]